MQIKVLFQAVQIPAEHTEMVQEQMALKYFAFEGMYHAMWRLAHFQLTAKAVIPLTEELIKRQVRGEFSLITLKPLTSLEPSYWFVKR